jgi:threonylcarbamoyladenosine tRNA methylthiotransferase MtaB
MSSFSIRNFGCRVNQAEAFAWTEAFRDGGLRFERDPGRSDFVVVNSCTLTSRADRDVKKFIRKISRDNPRAGLIVTGCYAGPAREEIEKIPQVLLVVPNNEKPGLPERILHLARGKAPGPDEEAACGDQTSFRCRALLKIQDGCDSRCAFCVIPSVRGKSVSVEPAEVLASVRSLTAAGYREIVLAGIHLSSYGENLNPRVSLSGLLREVEKVEGLGRVRLSSLDPRRLDRELLEHMAGNPRICQHFHLSLQHASERVLESMGRTAGPEAYGPVLSELRRRSPEAWLGADIIVGFPGETEDDFSLLEDFLRRSPLTSFHVFPYSPRPGTPAAARPQVPDRTKKARSIILRRLSAERSFEFRAAFLGRELEGVVVRNGRGGNGNAERRAEVLTGNYFKVLVPTCPASARETVRVRIGRVLPRSTEGEVIEP